MELEGELAGLREQQRWHELASRLVSGYGPEILGFLATLSGDYADASDAFAQACEDMWRALPRFEQRSSFQTWFYTLSRHALSRLRRSPAFRKRDALSEISEIADRVRSETAPHLRSEVKTGVAAICTELSEEDRALLVLRVDRGLSWDDVARVMFDDAKTTADVTRFAARLRKRFQTLKETIRERARELGVADPGDGE